MSFRSVLRRIFGHSTHTDQAQLQPWDRAAIEAERTGVIFRRETGEGYSLARYEKDGRFDYETYRRIQQLGNQTKIDLIFTTEESIGLIARHAQSRINPVNRILCHGTRNGTEQKWFQRHFPKAEVLGTEISETATNFPMTLRWDFHEIRDGWEGHWDILYSNSWDHTYDPHKLFSVWARSLRPGGLLYLEHTRFHEEIDRLDLFGADPVALRKFVEQSGLFYIETLDAPDQQIGRKVLVFYRQ